MEEYYVEKLKSYMRYQDFSGNEVPIIFIHGLGCASSFDYPQVAAQDELVKQRRILIDLLGAGYSDKPENFDYSVASHAAYLKEFIDDIGIQEFVLFGHSLGGSIAIELANLLIDTLRR